MRELCIWMKVLRMDGSESLSEASAQCLSCEVVGWRVGHTAAGHVGGGVLGEKGKQDENPSSGRQACCGREGKAGKTLLAMDVDDIGGAHLETACAGDSAGCPVCFHTMLRMKRVNLD